MCSCGVFFLAFNYLFWVILFPWQVLIVIVNDICLGTFGLGIRKDSHVAWCEFLLPQYVREDGIWTGSTGTVIAGGSVDIYTSKNTPALFKHTLSLWSKDTVYCRWIPFLIYVLHNLQHLAKPRTTAFVLLYNKHTPARFSRGRSARRRLLNGSTYPSSTQLLWL